METTMTSGSDREIARATAAWLTVLGRVYTLIEGTSPPHYADAAHYVSIQGYPGAWRAHASVYGPGACVMVGLSGDGPTPEDALVALTESYGAIETQRVRMVELVEAALGAGREA